MRSRNDIINDITDFIFIDDIPQKADVIFVPGNSSYLPGERAAELYKKSFAPIIVPSGRAPYGKKEFKISELSGLRYKGNYKTESEYITDILLQNGVPQKAILCEDKAEYTKQNAMYSSMLLQKHGIKVQKAIICCKSVHARRALLYYSYYFPDTEFLIAAVATNGVDKSNWYKTEIGYNKVFSEIEKIGDRFPELMRETSEVRKQKI